MLLALHSINARNLVDTLRVLFDFIFFVGEFTADLVHFSALKIFFWVHNRKVSLRLVVLIMDRWLAMCVAREYLGECVPHFYFSVDAVAECGLFLIQAAISLRTLGSGREAVILAVIRKMARALFDGEIAQGVLEMGHASLQDVSFILFFCDPLGALRSRNYLKRFGVTRLLL